MSENLLHLETSPYLLQHRDNPVHWMPWGESPLELARQQNKPILLSIGYAACHWCHVMAHECFENPDIAALMNKQLINVKVDREERPDLDTIYQSALAMLGEHGGWPLTMFLTPNGEPFWGGTYFPPTPRFGRPGFPDVVTSISETFSAEPERIRQNVDAIQDGLSNLSKPTAGQLISADVSTRIAETLANEVDLFCGGIGGAPKFPQPAIFEQIWRAWKRTENKVFKRATITTLNNICQGGIYDHLGGGFARYSVDERWLVPHFEKMLYDNAELVRLLTMVWQETRAQLYADRVAESVGWVLREMVTEHGGFASSLDADTEGQEGKFHVWSESEIDKLLGCATAEFKRIYDVSRMENWEGGSILNRLGSMELLDRELEAKLLDAKRILFEARSSRVPPGKDDKVLVDWNGLMISALAFAGDVFDQPSWVGAATRAFEFICDKLSVDGRLNHSWRAGMVNNPATLDDYANMCHASLILFEVTGDTAYIDQVESWLAIVDRHYRAPDGGYYLTADDTPNLIIRTKSAADSSTPSGNGTLVGVFAKLFYLTGKDDYRTRSEQIVRTFSGELNRQYFPLSTLINACELLENALQIVIVGDRQADDTTDLRRMVCSVSLPNRILSVIPTAANLPANHPATGKDRVDGKATAYVCRGPTCSAPITDPKALANYLESA